MSSLLASSKLFHVDLSAETEMTSLIDMYRNTLLFTTIEYLTDGKIHYVENRDTHVTGIHHATNRDNIFIRDVLFPLHNKDVILLCKRMMNDALEVLPSMPRHYKRIIIEDGYFEGGNMLYLPSEDKNKSILFHGTTPNGFYRCTSSRTDYDFPPKKTNKILNEVLKKHNVIVEGLELNKKLIYDESGRNAANNHYYHLGCFMTILPNNSLLILNMNILSPESQDIVKKYFSKIIDMKYEPYILRSFIPNPLCIGDKDNFTILFSSRLPEICKYILSLHHLKFITSACLDSREDDFIPELADKVVELLHKKGYQSATAENLGQHIPNNENQYTLHGTPNIDDYYTQNNTNEFKIRGNYHYSIDWTHETGGVHSLTL
jgi:hypothetical protein